MYIKLTLPNGTTPVWVNFNNVVCFQTYDDASTMLVLVVNIDLYVAETPEQIENKLIDARVSW